MAHIEIPVGENSERHVTIVHFDKMDGSKAEAVQNILFELQQKVKRPPVGKFGMYAMVGPRKDKRAMWVESQYVRHIRQALGHELSTKGIEFSDNFAFSPHVTDPLRQWRPGMDVPFLPWITFKWKDHFMLDYELGVNTDATA